MLRGGGVIAYPTEGVWGLGCDPFNEAATLRVLDIKQRDIAKGLILIAASLPQLDDSVDWDALPAHARDTVLATWPGPATWIVPARPRVPRAITGGHDSVAVRVSAHPEVVALCAAFDGVIVSTSANRAGAPSPRCVHELDPQLVACTDGVLAGETCGSGQPSTIRDARTGAVLRG